MLFLTTELKGFVNYIKFYKQEKTPLYYFNQDNKRWETSYILIQNRKMKKSEM